MQASPMPRPPTATVSASCACASPSPSASASHAAIIDKLLIRTARISKLQIEHGIRQPASPCRKRSMSIKKPGKSRRQFLRKAGAAAALAAFPFARSAHAQSKRQATMRLDWLYQGPNAGFMVALDKGYYEQAGLNVEIGPGKGSGSTAQLVASKATQFGFADGFVIGA